MTDFMVPIGPFGQARRAARCSASGKGRNEPKRAPMETWGLHRRPFSYVRPPRCSPLVVRCTTAQTAPNGRI